MIAGRLDRMPWFSSPFVLEDLVLPTECCGRRRLSRQLPVGPARHGPDWGQLGELTCLISSKADLDAVCGKVIQLMEEELIVTMHLDGQPDVEKYRGRT